MAWPFTPDVGAPNNFVLAVPLKSPEIMFHSFCCLHLPNSEQKVRNQVLAFGAVSVEMHTHHGEPRVAICVASDRAGPGDNARERPLTVFAFFANEKCLGSINVALKSVFVEQDATFNVGDHVKLPEENPSGKKCGRLLEGNSSSRSRLSPGFHIMKESLHYSS